LHDRIIGYLLLWMFPKFVRPNHITIFRMLATPAVFWLIMTENWSWGFAAFVLVAMTDALDGSMARLRGQITAWGTLFDPLADKVLIGGTLFIFIWKYIDMYIGGAVILLELIVIAAGILNVKKGLVFSANKFGKAKMLLQCLGVGLIIFSLVIKSQNMMIVAEWTLVLSIGFAMVNIFNKDISL
jgi:phosphatidylglycerophosphate synthase